MVRGRASSKFCHEEYRTNIHIHIHSHNESKHFEELRDASSSSLKFAVVAGNCVILNLVLPSVPREWISWRGTWFEFNRRQKEAAAIIHLSMS